MLAPSSVRTARLYRFKGFKPNIRRRKRIVMVVAHSATMVAEQAVGFPRKRRKPTMVAHSATTNVLFKYLYRDASNCNGRRLRDHIQNGEAIFTNRTFLPLAEIEKQIRACLNDGKYFIAQQVNIEERFFDALYDDDHPWHEYVCVEATTLAAFDPDNWNQHQHRRDITEFLVDMEKVKQAGWDEISVRTDVARLLSDRKTKCASIWRKKWEMGNEHT